MTRTDTIDRDAIAEMLERIGRDCAPKRSYSTSLDAARIAHRRMQDGAPPLRVYRCPWCGDCHLTKSGGPK